MKHGPRRMVTGGRSKRQATSLKLQAASVKLQASSLKPQAQKFFEFQSNW